jgi:DNA-binding LacI/PurR family transcriptional regulator
MFLSILGSTLHRYGYDLLVSQTINVNAETESRYFLSGRADGFILLGRGQDHSYLNKMAQAHVPLVVWGSFLPKQKYCSVGIDNVAAGRMVVEHLLKLGRRRIAIIADNMPGLTTESNLRYQGYCQALQQAGLDIDDRLFASATYSAQSGYQAMNTLLSSAPDLDAVFVAYSDMVAVAAMQVLIESGRRVPNDVSVIGFDNINLAAFSNPPLTSVSQSLEKGGIDLLIEKLIAQISGSKVVSAMLDAELVVRRSCGSAISNLPNC